ncbi:MAG TPA: N-acetyl sugar amidotransferase [Spirochaetia bacterium]|nr:N-acetyl sugar amidotransferase [Spirochaetia bacterium]
MTTEYRICTRCIMDTTDPLITFDAEGVCSHCRDYEIRAGKELYSQMDGDERLGRLVDEIKEKGKNKKYDCIIGLSGGMDSTMVAYTVKNLGLRPLAIHLDNEWDADIAVSNIENIIKRLGIEYRAVKTDWEEYKDLQLAFLKASIPNAEIPTDHAIVAKLYQTAAEEKIRYIISGGNIVTEAIMPFGWGYDAKDLKYIKAIHKRFGSGILKTFPKLTLFNWVYYTFVKKIKFIPILNYIRYNKKQATGILEKEIQWKHYGAKHFESVYTRFFQSYILPIKFTIDKRKAHFSTLINSGQMTREDAVREMEKDPYPTEKMMREDRKHVLDKLGISGDEFDAIMKQPVKTFRDYPNNYFFFYKLRVLVAFAKRIATHN